MINIRDLKNNLDIGVCEQEKQSIQSKIDVLKMNVEKSIREANKNIQYTTKEMTIENIIEKYGVGLDSGTNELFIPDYQRAFKWSKKILSRFIESIFMDFPIPYIYVADVSDDDEELDGRIEIIDGSQRIRALYYFVTNEVELTDLKELKILEGFKFEDLSAGRQRRFLRESLRFVELKGDVKESHRRDLFERINSGVKELVGAESRHGAEYANSNYYRNVIEECAKNDLFESLAPLSDKKRANGDHRELVTRFFAFYHDFDNYNGNLGEFLEQYLRDIKDADEERVRSDVALFNSVMTFIKNNFIFGFRRTETSKTTTRTRFDSLAVGAAKALQEQENLTKSIAPVSEWAFSEEFLKVINSDAANNKSNVTERIEYAKNKFLGE